MHIQQLLFSGFSTTVLRQLTELLAGDCQMILDGIEVRDISTHASGRRAFVVKAWLDGEGGPALKFRANWGELQDGRLWYQPGPLGPWIPADIRRLEYIEGLADLALRIDFSVNLEEEHHLLLLGPSLLEQSG